MATPATGPQIVDTQLPGEPIDDTNAPPLALDQDPYPAAHSGVASRLEAYRAGERRRTQLARVLARVFTADELAQLFDAIPDGWGEPVQVLADALGTAWGNVR